MEVAETVVEWAAEAASSADPVWFVVRQPGVLKYVEGRCGIDTDLCGAALLGAMAIHSAFEKTLGVAPPRVPSSLLTRAEQAIMAEAEAPALGEDGVGVRQPSLAGFVASIAVSPPVPLSPDEREQLGITLLSVLYAFDDVSTGRSIP